MVNRLARTRGGRGRQPSPGWADQESRTGSNALPARAAPSNEGYLRAFFFMPFFFEPFFFAFFFAMRHLRKKGNGNKKRPSATHPLPTP